MAPSIRNVVAFAAFSLSGLVSAEAPCSRTAELPSKDSTLSFWHTQPSKKLMGLRSTEDLPSTADVVVVGSGISGAFGAQELVNGGKNVLMLEAREACWGATGRNGGHCKPGIYFNKAHIAKFELDTYHYLKDYVADNKVDCDWNSTGGVAGFPSQTYFDKAVKNLAEVRKNDSSVADKVTPVTGAKALAELRLTNMVGAMVQDDAAKLWPYKLVAHVLERLVDKGAARFNLQTNTAATRVERIKGSSNWLVHTPRGKVIAKDVLLATNAYTSRVLPDFKHLLYPVRGQVSAVQPTNDSIPLPRTDVWYVNDNGDDVYLIQRDVSDTIILGGLRAFVPGKEECISRDNVVNPKIVDLLRNACSSALKLRPQGQPEEKTLDSVMDWTGIMGFSSDNRPFVGAVPESLGGGKGLWVSAGYTGHGMPVAARTAMSVAQQILGVTNGIKVPPEYVLTEERAQKLK